MLLNHKKKNNVEKCGETDTEEISRSKPLGQKSWVMEILLVDWILGGDLMLRGGITAAMFTNC